LGENIKHVFMEISIFEKIIKKKKKEIKEGLNLDAFI